jgi:hypothetical protein
VRAAREGNAREIVEAVISAVRDHSSVAGGPEDDLTVSVIKVG